MIPIIILILTIAIGLLITDLMYVKDKIKRLEKEFDLMEELMKKLMEK